MFNDVATLTLIGRAVSLYPAELGTIFETDCTITLAQMGTPSMENNWKRQMVYTPQREFWYDTHPTTGQRLFFTHRGFAKRIVDTLQRRGITVNVLDAKPSGLCAPDFSKVAGVKWRGRQSEIFVKILAELAKSMGGVLDCPTGWGKSFLLAQWCKVLPTAKIVIAEPSIDIANEVHSALSGHFKTGIVGDGKRRVERVTVCVANSIKYCDKESNLVIFDECHVAPAPSHRENLMMFGRALFLGVTASPEGRADQGDAYLEALFGPVIDKVGYQEAVEGGNVVQLTVIQVPVRSGPNVQSYGRRDLKNRVGIWMNAQRNNAVKWAVEDAKSLHPGWQPQILIMVETALHAYALKKILPDFTVVTGEVDDERASELAAAGVLETEVTGSEPGDVVYKDLCTKKDRERYKAEFSAGTLRFAIATMVWSKGVNFLDLDVLIRADGTASDITSTQVPGRLSRLGSDGKKGGAYLYDFDDIFSPDLGRRSNGRFASYSRNGWKLEKRT